MRIVSAVKIKTDLIRFIILNTPQLCCGDKGHTYSTEVCFSSTGFRFHAAAPRMLRSSAARVRRRRSHEKPPKKD
jgi:hypothetical protein